MSERRHRISGSELGPVTTAIEHELHDLLLTKSDIHTGEQLFRLWYRIMIHREGRPDYPDPITWGVIESYLSTKSIMVPFHEVEAMEVRE